MASGAKPSNERRLSSSRLALKDVFEELVNGVLTHDSQKFLALPLKQIQGSRWRDSKRNKETPENIKPDCGSRQLLRTVNYSEFGGADGSLASAEVEKLVAQRPGGVEPPRKARRAGLNPDSQNLDLSENGH
eukprot:s1688_g6.t1